MRLYLDNSTIICQILNHETFPVIQKGMMLSLCLVTFAILKLNKVIIIELHTCIACKIL